METRPANTFVSALIAVCAHVAAAALAFLAAAMLTLGTMPASAQTTIAADAPTGLDSALEQQVRQLALDGSRAGATAAADTAGAQAGRGPGAAMPRIEVSVGQLDQRLRLAPCQHVEPYLPDGTRLWGKSRIGLRCTQGVSKWNVYLPITVKVFGKALVATSGISSGSVLTTADLAQAEVDLAEDNSTPVTNADLAVGRSLTRSLKAGQSLRQSHLKPRQYFAAGETVTVLAQGDGFSVASEGQALNPGIEGQAVRVRIESGRILTGQPIGERKVELQL
jgi:flagella basal body P-ring formation protein FlgA